MEVTYPMSIKALNDFRRFLDLLQSSERCMSLLQVHEEVKTTLIYKHFTRPVCSLTCPRAASCADPWPRVCSAPEAVPASFILSRADTCFPSRAAKPIPILPAEPPSFLKPPSFLSFPTCPWAPLLGKHIFFLLLGIVNQISSRTHMGVLRDHHLYDTDMMERPDGVAPIYDCVV
uniref:Uncharacterized protein n=1 Tax=Cucumis melo TaxID=3656 RepID=A0A9I9EDV5_CUCME